MRILIGFWGGVGLRTALAGGGDDAAADDARLGGALRGELRRADTGIAAVADMAAMVVEGPVDGLKAISCKYLSCFVRSVGFRGQRRKRADRARGYVARRARSLRRDREGVGESLTAQRRRVATVRRRHRMIARRSGKGGEKTLGDQPV